MKKSYVYLLTTFMLWGSLYVVSQFVLGKIPTFTVAMFRYLIAFIALSLISLKSEKEKIEKSDYKYFFIMGFIGYFISVDCQLLGTKIAGGSMASLINSLNPVIISVMAMIILNEKLEMNKIVGIVLSLAGVYMIIGTGANIQFLGVLISSIEGNQNNVSRFFDLTNASKNTYMITLNPKPKLLIENTLILPGYTLSKQSIVDLQSIVVIFVELLLNMFHNTLKED